MAVMLRETESSEKHISAARRLSRTSKRVKNCEKFIPMITGANQNLASKMDVAKRKTEEREDAQDDLDFCESELNDSVRNASDGCKKVDRDNPGTRAFDKVFSDINVSGFTSMDVSKKPDISEQIAVRMDTYGKDHPLQAFATDMRSKAASVRKAISNLAEKQSVFVVAQTEEELAKAQLRKTYENIYLAAKMDFGSVVAEKIFPKLASSRVSSKKGKSDTRTKTRSEPSVTGMVAAS